MAIINKRTLQKARSALRAVSVADLLRLSGDSRYRAKTLGYVEAKNAIGRGQEELRHGPTEAYFEVTNACDLRCIQCQRTHGLTSYLSRGDGMLTADRVRALEHLLPGLTRAFLMGNGEPLLNPDLPEIIYILKSYGVRVAFFTHAMHLTEDLCYRFVAAGVDDISFSMDGATAEVFNRIRVGADFDTVVKNIRMFRAIRDDLGSGKPRFSLAGVAMSLNVHQAADLVRLGWELGADLVFWERMMRQESPGYLRFYEKHHLGTMDPEIVDKHFAEARETGSRLGVEVRIGDEEQHET